MKPYPVSFFHRENDACKTLISRDIYRFKTRLDRVYFIEVERHKENIYIAKFYLRIHKNLKDKYKLVINDGDGFRILSTCIDLALRIYSEDPMASFGFIGENRIEESTINTQRYRVYSILSKRYFSPDKYLHFKDDNNSIYFLINKDNKNLNETIIEKEVTQYL